MAWSHYSLSPYENISFSECQFWALSCGTCRHVGKCEQLSVWIRTGITNLQISGSRKDNNISHLILANPIRTTKDLKNQKYEALFNWGARLTVLDSVILLQEMHVNIHSWIYFYSSLTCSVLITTSVLIICTKKFCRWQKNCRHEQICSIFNILLHRTYSTCAGQQWSHESGSEYMLAGTLT